MVRLFAGLFTLFTIGVLAGTAGFFWLISSYGGDLPDHQYLAEYEPPTVTRIHAGDGRLLAEYARERRVFVPIAAIPQRVINAFLSAEDKGFYSHPGLDVLGIGRAVLTNIRNLQNDRRPVGASTITQQVAKNFLLSNEVSITRKLKEAVLAIRIEGALSKDRILELYLNEIFLGYRSYGVAAAALNYFNKALAELTLAEAAYLAALPKAPNNYHPIRRTEAAIARRNWVIGRMLEDGHIAPDVARAAMGAPLEVRRRDATEIVEAEYFAEEVRRELERMYGEEALYEGGLSVRATVDPRLQAIATEALRDGLMTYDRRHGWRGPIARLRSMDDWRAALTRILPPAGGEAWQLAVVLDASQRAGAEIGLVDGSRAVIPFDELKWARRWIKGQRIGRQPQRPADVLARADVVLVEPLPVDAEASADTVDPARFALRQIPAVQGGLVAMDVHTGRVLAMSGGFAASMSQFNRATQALRQPGSSFKPFVYLAALDNGFTPSSLVMDAPFEYDPGFGQPMWRPQNYSHEFYGPTPLRVGIEKSRNVMTVRLAHYIGMDKVKTIAETFGIFDVMPPFLPLSLGAGETTVLRMTTAYAMLANGGKRIQPSFIDHVQDRHGRTIFRHDTRPCPLCRGLPWTADMRVPDVPDTRETIADPRTVYQIVSILEGVTQRGTAVRLRSLNRPLAGKTGTTNESRDTWFMGFSPDLAVGLYIGFDQPEPLGRRETGSSVALPVFKQVMEQALAGEPTKPFRVAKGVSLVRVNPKTGALAEPGETPVIWEAFLPGTDPGSGDRFVLDGSANTAYDDTTWGAPSVAERPRTDRSGGGASVTGFGTGGLY